MISRHSRWIATSTPSQPTAGFDWSSDRNPWAVLPWVGWVTSHTVGAQPPRSPFMRLMVAAASRHGAEIDHIMATGIEALR